MQYQVVARSGVPTEGNWEYYPYLAPSRDKAAAERLARHAAQQGYEAAILQSVTLEMLMHIARAVVERQDEQFVPMLRYTSDALTERMGARGSHRAETGTHAQSPSNPYIEGPDKAALDARRLLIESGAGGDVAASGTWLLSLPSRMDVVQRWLRLRERVVRGQIGGDMDGAGDVDASGRHADTDDAD